MAPLLPFMAHQFSIQLHSLQTLRDGAPCSVCYGIESYYVQESTGHDYEDAIRNPNQEVWAEIKLDKNGRATLVGLHIEPAPDAPLVAPVD